LLARPLLLAKKVAKKAAAAPSRRRSLLVSQLLRKLPLPSLPLVSRLPRKQLLKRLLPRSLPLAVVVVHLRLLRRPKVERNPASAGFFYDENQYVVRAHIIVHAVAASNG
jgi:hypothetical protein